MYIRLLALAIVGTLVYGLWISPDFTEIAAGVAIFLFGMLSLEKGFSSFTGGLLEKILKKTTNTLSKSLCFGIVSTTVMQSSSLVSVITISFLSAGLIGLAAGIGIIFGANLGTTTGAWLVAGFGLKVKISAYAMPMLVFGVLLIFQKNKYAKGIGYVLSGLGFLFLGIHHMKEGFETFKDTIDLTQFSIPGYPGLFLFTSIGIFATVVMQSSHATLVLIITALSAGQISYENALALAIGANVGTTITAIIGALSANEQGKRLAAAHLIFNMITGLLAVVLIHQFVWSVDYLSEVIGIRADDYTLKLALFHTLFNLLGVVVMLPFINLLVRALEKLIKGKAKGVSEPRFLYGSAIDFPDTAVEAVRKESMHIFENSFHIIARGISISPARIRRGETVEQMVYESNKVLDIDIEQEYEHRVKGIFGEIITFITKAPFNWQSSQSGRLHWMRNANQKLIESVKATKHLQSNLQFGIISENPSVRQAYNSIRIQITTILKELYNVSKQLENEDESEDEIMGESKEDALLALDALKLLIRDNDRERWQAVTELLRKDQISSSLATSLLNDNRYTHDICEGLVAFGETMFTSKDSDRAVAEREVALEPSELDDLTKA